LNQGIQFRRPGIIGVGVVGSAVRNYLQLTGICPLLYDPFKELGSVEEINQADLVYICVPTPYVGDRGFDGKAVATALSLLRGEKTVVIKSTVIPGTTERLQREYPQHQILFNPEFLREASADADFLTPDRQIVGFCGDGSVRATDVLAALPRAPYEAVVPASAAELTKYATNAFLALKVIFGNELFDLCQGLSTDYEVVKEGIGADERIGMSHLDVLDAGYRGYGGKCLPKDTRSLLDLADDLGVEMRLLAAAHEVNSRLRAPTSLRRQTERVQEESLPSARLAG
jgi:UDPglucose 6-dehydrogenase